MIKVKSDYTVYKNIARVATLNGIGDETVKKYLKTDTKALTAKLNSKLEKLTLDKHVNIIYKMLKDGFDIGDISKYLRHNIDETLDKKDIVMIVKRVSARYFNRIAVNKKTLRNSIRKESVRITRSEILKYLTTIHKKKSKKIRQHWPLLKKEYPILQELEKAYRYFHNCLKEKTATQIDSYIAEYSDSEIPKIKTFAKGISRDLVAIKEGIKTGITSGFVEGGNNKIKLIKRLGYGRMKFQRLKQKILTFNFF
jgi:predicted transcriptional regulator